MKFLHLGDLHIGKRMNDVSLIEDQKYALDKIVNIALEEEVNAVLLSGDIFDKSVPSDEAFVLYGDFINQLVSNNIKIFIISGNHDSLSKLNYCSDIFEKSEIYISDDFKGQIDKVTLEDEYGEINIYLLPFLREGKIQKCFPNSDILNLSDGFRVIFGNNDIDFNNRNILLAHQFLIGSERSESEEVSVGGVDGVDAEQFRPFDYVALGHLHKTQSVKYDQIKYSGSLLKYSFSETDHTKGPIIVNIKEKGNIEIKQVPIDFMRDVRVLKGEFKDIMALDDSDDYIKVILTDEIVPVDAKYDLQLKFNNMLMFRIENSKTAVEGDADVNFNIENVSIDELFKNFYKERTNTEISDEQMKVIVRIFKKMEEDAK